MVAAVAPARANILQDVAAAKVSIGDLEDLENTAKRNGAQLVISNSHAVESSRRLGVPLLRAGFPQYDLIGGYQRLWVGYRGTRQTLFDLANMVAEHGHHEPEPYVSVHSQRTGEVVRHLRLVKPIEEDAMTVKIAFATSDRRAVNQHFGAAESFAIYEVGECETRLIEVAEFIETAMDGHEGKLAAKVELLGDCAAVYCNAVGASAIQQLLAKSIQPMRVDEGTLIDELLCGLQKIWSATRRCGWRSI